MERPHPKSNYHWKGSKVKRHLIQIQLMAKLCQKLGQGLPLKLQGLPLKLKLQPPNESIWQ